MPIQKMDDVDNGHVACVRTAADTRGDAEKDVILAHLLLLQPYVGESGRSALVAEFTACFLCHSLMYPRYGPLLRFVVGEELPKPRVPFWNATPAIRSA